MKRTKRIITLTASLLLFAGTLQAQREFITTPEVAALTKDTNAVVNESDTTNGPVSPSEGTSENGIGTARRGVDRAAIVVFGKDVELKAGDSAEAVVVIGGSAKILGKVRKAVVAIGGDVIVEGEVERGVVAVFGNVRAGQGAKVDGDAVAFGGKIDAADGAVIGRKPVELDFGGLSVGLRKWFIHCALMLRPLAPQVGWVWAIAGFFFLFYLLVALVLPQPVHACVAELTRRPATTLFMGFLTKLFLPIVIAILGITGIGLILVPFIIAALIFGAIIGKVAIIESFGLGFGRRFGVEFLEKTLIAFLLGTLLITLLYMVPVLGLVTFGVISIWGLGGAVVAAFSGLRRELPRKPTVPPQAPGAAGMAPASAAPAAGGPTEGASIAPQPTPAPSNLPEAFAYPRAGVWERMGAAFLDIMLVSIVGAIAGHLPPLGFLIALAYFAGMWAWKGTTIGGIVLGLKVVRLDGQPVSFMVSLVRALAAVFSVFVLFLGFLWIAWDADKQGWHDKIAGTVVVRLPRGTPLVCV